MTATLRATANDILNRVAAEVGLEPTTDPWGADLQEFRQMRYLLNIAGEELCQLYPWEVLVRAHSITTQAGDTGNYELPDDFLYMINQTGWERSENVPLYGPLSAQDWTYLLGRDLVSQTIYASFRINSGVFRIFPQPPPENLDINFEYICRNWVIDSSASSGASARDITDLTLLDRVLEGSDTPVFDRTLISRMLKVKFLEAKGMDTTKAQADLNQAFGLLTSHDKGAEILNPGFNKRTFPYLNMYQNTPDSGYGKY